MKIVIGLVTIIAIGAGAIVWLGSSEPKVAKAPAVEPPAARAPAQTPPPPRFEGRRPQLAQSAPPETDTAEVPQGSPGYVPPAGIRRRPNRGDFDTNHDGRLDASEREAMRASRRERWRNREIEAFDANGDGQLDDKELAARDQVREQRRKERNAEILSAADTDADGKISPAEVAQDMRLQRMLGDFEAADANHDGSLDQQELDDAFASQQEMWRDRRMKRLGDRTPR